MSEKNVNYCNQCPNHCPETALQCGRGRKHFAQVQDPVSGENGKREQTEQNYHKNQEHGKHHVDGHGHSHGHNHGREFSRERDDLYGMMRACGHYLFHRAGKGPGQGKILSILSERESMTQKELQEMLQIQSGSISEILSKLEEKGMILRKKDEDDKRMSVIELTEAGKTEIVARKQKSDEKKLFDVLDETEQEELKKLLGKLLESWK